MPLTARDKTVVYEPIPEDLHLAVCYGVWDIGTQFSEKYGKSVHKVIIGWEIPGCRIEIERDGQKISVPKVISKRYTISLHKKSDLRKDLESWRGRKFTDEELEGFDLKNLLGAPCQIQILHNKVDDRVYANISAIIKAPQGVKIKPENPLAFFSFEDGDEIPENTPGWIADIIKQSEEYRKMHSYDEDDDVIYEKEF